MRGLEGETVNYRVWVPDRDQTEADAREVQATDHFDAVERWAWWDDHSSADFSIIGGEPATVMVRAMMHNPPSPAHKVIVSGETVPQNTTGH